MKTILPRQEEHTKEECLICKAPLAYLQRDVEMEKEAVVCTFSDQNNQCISTRCPFSQARQR